MTMSMDRYTELLNKFSRIFNNYIECEDLDQLKKEYEDKIDSIRVLETIKDITALLKVLDKRGILKYNDISVLRQISKPFSSDPIIEKLFLDYDFWLKENSSQINNLYCCGESSNLLNSYSHTKLYETAQPCHTINESTNQKFEEQCSDHLLSTESHVNAEIQIIQSFPFYSYWTRCRIKRCDRSSIITFLLLVSFIGVICILVKIFYQFSALVPIADSHSKNLAEQSKSNMPKYVSNVNIGNINAVSVAKNENQYYFMNHPNTASSIRDETLKDMIKKKLSRKVGRSWEDVSRRLELEESVIENIESKFFNDPQGSEKMFTKALELYFAERRPNWKIELMKALEDSRRRDLKEIVQEMINQHHFD